MCDREEPSGKDFSVIVTKLFPQTMIIIIITDTGKRR